MTKKIILLAVICFSVSAAFAQKKVGSKTESVAKQDKIIFAVSDGGRVYEGRQ